MVLEREQLDSARASPAALCGHSHCGRCGGRWSRFGRANCARTCVLRSCLVHATRVGTSPGPSPLRRGASEAGGSSGAGSPGGRALSGSELSPDRCPIASDPHEASVAHGTLQPKLLHAPLPRPRSRLRGGEKLACFWVPMVLPAERPGPDGVRLQQDGLLGARIRFGPSMSRASVVCSTVTR